MKKDRIKAILNTMFDSVLNSIIVIIVCVLTFASTLALVAVHIKIWRMGNYFQIGDGGVARYFNFFSEYYILFGSTIVINTTYFGFKRMDAATVANLEKVKQDRFQEWTKALDLRYEEIKAENPRMQREFVRLRYIYFTLLHERDFSIKHAGELEQMFSAFRQWVDFFETSNERHISMGGCYADAHHSYSFDGFRFLFFGGTLSTYQNAYPDLQALYIGAMNPNRIIDPTLYQVAMQNYNRNR